MLIDAVKSPFVYETFHLSTRPPRTIERLNGFPIVPPLLPNRERRPLNRYLDFSTFAGTPAAMTLSGSGFVTTAPAPTTVLAPTSAMTTAALPIHAPAPIRTTVRVCSCSRIGRVGSPVP